MALTDNCDFYSEVDEAGINLLVRHIMRKRPSLFNYATDMIVHDQTLLCVPIDAAPEVSRTCSDSRICTWPPGHPAGRRVRIAGVGPVQPPPPRAART